MDKIRVPLASWWRIEEKIKEKYGEEYVITEMDIKKKMITIKKEDNNAPQL